MRTLPLRERERDGLVARVVYPVVPPRVEYFLTPLGSTLLAPLVAMAEWADTHRADIEGARVAYDARPAASPTPWLVPATGAGSPGEPEAEALADYAGDRLG